MKTLNINVKKLSTNETVRYNGPADGGGHGTYTIHLITPEGAVDIHMSLEAIVQLKQRVDASFQHMITH